MRDSDRELSPGDPPYTVRVSRRVRRVRLTVTAEDGLVVVVPRGFPQAEVPSVVRGRRSWALRALERVAERRERLSAAEGLPACIGMPAVGLAWEVDVLRSHAPVRATARDGRVVLAGDPSDLPACEAALRHWAREAAAPPLRSLLDAVALEHRLRHLGATVRAQRSRWGSCSPKGRISLNYRLAFLPPEVARHVMLHELVHTVHPDHSPAFWEELARRDPDTSRKRRALKHAWRDLPGWVLRDVGGRPAALTPRA